MGFSEFLDSIGLDALWALVACLGLALVSRHLQDQPQAPPHGFEEGDEVYVKDDNLKGVVSDVEASGRIWVELPELNDFQWYPPSSLVKTKSVLNTEPVE